MSWTKVASLSEVPVGAMKQVTIDDLDIAIYHTDQGFYATSDVCTHASAFLTDGKLVGCIVECPKHGGKFNVTNGEPTAFPCVIPVETFPIEVRNDEIWVEA